MSTLVATCHNAQTLGAATIAVTPGSGSDLRREPDTAVLSASAAAADSDWARIRTRYKQGKNHGLHIDTADSLSIKTRWSHVTGPGIAIRTSSAASSAALMSASALSAALAASAGEGAL
jgi:hypothetical protein